jgi:hypothetical protein
MNNSTKTGSIKIKVLRPDWDDISEFEITATSNDWQASLKFWGNEDLFKDFGNQLKSFPNNAKDAVTFELGAELTGRKPEWAYYLLLRAYCYDEVGHTAIEIAINNNLQNPDSQNAQFNIFSEPQQINEFGKLLSEWDPKKEDQLVWETKI